MLALTPDAAVQRLPPRRVLVVEDEALVSMLIVDQLEELGHVPVGPAFSVAEALKLAASEAIDVALIDWNLRGESAGNVVDILVGRNVPCVFVTGYGEHPDGHHAEVRVLTKPFLKDDLRRVIERMFRS